MLDRFRDFIRQQKLFRPHDRLLVAVSGGLDSMALLNLLRELENPLAVAHCNFQLRDEESDQDEQFVQQVCQQHQIRFFNRRFDTKNYAEKAGLSLQMAARDLRYAWFREVARAENFQYVVTAHHLNDNLETVLLRLTSGAGLDQLTGIPVKNEMVVRPLLFATREELREYAEAEKIKWREDSSNASDDYQRNFIRHHVVPALKKINPSLEQTFLVSMDKLKGAMELMTSGLAAFQKLNVHQQGDCLAISKVALQSAGNPIFYCYEILKPFGFEWDRCLQLTRALSGQPGAQFHSATHCVTVDRDFVFVSLKEEETVDVKIEEGKREVMVSARILSLNPSTGNDFQVGPAVASVDASKLLFPLWWRTWREGDAFFPLGMGHRKKISDFLIDEKVPLSEKGKVTVIVSGEDIVWVVGYRVDDRFKITSVTTSVLEMKIRNI